MAQTIYAGALGTGAQACGRFGEKGVEGFVVKDV